MSENGLPGFIQDYVKEGLCLIPVAKDKKPIVEWKQYQTRQPTHEELTQWFNGKQVNAAVVCGSISNNLVILDFDSEDAYHKFFDLEKIQKETPVIRTGRGFHVWFRTDTPVRSFKVPGLVDVKGEGGYCLVPPSIHGETGKQYQFVNSRRDPHLVTDLEKSTWKRAEELGYARKRFSEIQAPTALDGSSVAPNCVTTLSQGVEAGGRNDAAIHLASYWLNIRRLSKDYVLSWLNEWNNKNQSPLEQRELREVVDSAGRGGYVYRCCLGERTLRPKKLDELGLADEALLGTKAFEAAELVLEKYPVLTLDMDEILVYQNGVYRDGGERIISRFVEEKFHDLGFDEVSNNHFHSEVLGRIKRKTSVMPEAFDSDPFILNLENGLFDVRTFKLSEHRPDYPCLVQLPAKYDSEAKCPKIEKFLSQVAYSEDIPTIQEVVGVALWKRPIHKTTLFWGEGANGKSTFLRLLVGLLGSKNIASRSLQDLSTNRFASADLYGKMANIFADLPDEALKSTGWFKTLTGGDEISAERKYGHPFHFVNYAKLFFSCNKIPEVPKDDSDAFFRRWIIITFPYSFFGDRDNKNLINELSTDEEISGFLNWALEGLGRLQKKSWQFSDSKSVEEVRTEYTRKSSPVKAFILDCCTTEQFDSTNPPQVDKQKLFEAFSEYCKVHRLPTLDRTGFFRRVRDQPGITEHRIGPKGARVRVFEGIELKDEKEWGKDEDSQKTL